MYAGTRSAPAFLYQRAGRTEAAHGNIILSGGIDDTAIIFVEQGVMVIRVDTGEQAVVKYK